MATTTQSPPRPSQAPPFMAEVPSKQSSALQKVLQSQLVISFAEKYKVQTDTLFGVLMRCVFPKNKEGKIIATVDQFVAFITVAQMYDLNPYTKEIYAFPSKGGGVIPIVPIDGWVKVVQRQKDSKGMTLLDGIKYVDHFNPQGELDAITCIMRRKDMAEPIEITEYMVECVRDTDVWKKWPRRMLRHKSTIQCGRIAFGLSGIYDQDEAERILEAEERGEDIGETQILMPQRRIVAPKPVVETQIEVPANAAAEVMRDAVSGEEAGEESEAAPESKTGTSGKDTGNGAAHAEEHTEPHQEELLDEPPAQTAEPKEKPKPKQVLKVPEDQWISPGQKKKLFAVLNSAKAHTEAELRTHIWSEFGLEHVHEIPKPVFNELLAWAGGDKLRIK